ncbi:MAG: hypothetical protein ACQERZ_07160, partial [Fusobacteriota bacterium]
MSKKVILIMIIMTSFLNAQDDFGMGEDDMFSEEGMFSEDTVMVEEEDVVSDEIDIVQEETLGISGTVETINGYSKSDLDKAWISTDELTENKVNNTIQGNIMMDVRLENGIKSFMNAALYYYPAGKAKQKDIDISQLGLDTDILPYEDEVITELILKEFFLDYNWENKIYFRTGKQVLKWGRGYFWNPTDVINIEKKSFLDMDSSREGVYGIKGHIPFGVSGNLYGFLNVNQSDNPGDMTVSGKYEFLVKNTEMSVSSWLKKDKKPIYGVDISSRISDFDFRGEMSLNHGSEISIIDYDYLEMKKAANGWVPKISTGFTRSFDHGDITDRINITGEFYYNHVGYEENIFERLKNNNNLKINFIQNQYEPYSNSKYYTAFFGSIGKFIDNDMTYKVNGMVNLVDRSMILTNGLSYKPISDMTFNLDINT